MLRDETITNGFEIWNRETRKKQEVDEEELSAGNWPDTWRRWAEDKNVWKGIVKKHTEGRRRTHHQSMTREEQEEEGNPRMKAQRMVQEGAWNEDRTKQQCPKCNNWFKTLGNTHTGA